MLLETPRHAAWPAAALLALTLACASRPAPAPSPRTPHLGWSPGALPTPAQANQPRPSTTAWQSLSPAAFEAWLPSVALSPALPAEELDQLADLAAASNDDAPTALRAALILATLDREPAAARLADLLEARRPHPERPADAADVAAAAYLGTCAFAETLDLAARLAVLASDAGAHPDLEVRTECARSALFLGRNDVAPFLLRLTRLGTVLGRERDGDWHTHTTTTWSRNRAAEALAERLGIPCPYRGDASLVEREQAARALEAAWRALLAR